MQVCVLGERRLWVLTLFICKVERRRRDNINDKIQELCTIIPPEIFEGEVKPNKAIILTKTVDYVKLLQEIVQVQAQRAKELEDKLTEQ
jgi:hypothetical protein